MSDLLDSRHKHFENILGTSRGEDESSAEFFDVLSVEFIDVHDHVLLDEVE